MTTSETTAGRVPLWVAAAAPLVAIVALVAVFLVLDPVGGLRAVPPVEAVAFERTVLDEGAIDLHVRNDGPDPVTISQVLVNDAYWDFAMDDQRLDRLQTETVRIPYPWEEGLPVHIALITSTGVVIEHEIEAAALTPQPDLGTLGTYALLGLYIGVLPVALGLLWLPSLRRAPPRWVAFFLAFTAGLLVFLLVDTVAEGIELSGEAAAVLDGVGLFAIGVLVSVVVLVAVQRWGASRSTASSRADGMSLALLIAAGIGLHNLGEGLAVGAALAAGEVGLGTTLVLGFMLHNTTEGFAIVTPFGAGRKRPSLLQLALLGAIAGVPTIAGAWMGGFAFSPAWGALAFGVAAGAIAQVVWVLARSLGGERGLFEGMPAVGFVAGVAVMYATGLLAA